MLQLGMSVRLFLAQGPGRATGAIAIWLLLLLPLLFIALGLTPLACKQLHAVRRQLYHYPPYNAAAAHLSGSAQLF